MKGLPDSHNWRFVSFCFQSTPSPQSFVSAQWKSTVSDTRKLWHLFFCCSSSGRMEQSCVFVSETVQQNDRPVGGGRAVRFWVVGHNIRARGMKKKQNLKTRDLAAVLVAGSWNRLKHDIKVLFTARRGVTKRFGMVLKCFDCLEG